METKNIFERWKWVLREIEVCHYRILLTRVDESCPLYSSPDHIGLKVEKTHLEYVENEVDWYNMQTHLKYVKCNVNKNNWFWIWGTFELTMLAIALILSFLAPRPRAAPTFGWYLMRLNFTQIQENNVKTESDIGLIEIWFDITKHISMSKNNNRLTPAVRAPPASPSPMPPRPW